MARFDAWLARNDVTTHRKGACVEFGCGVGRCTIWLARRYEHVVALDVSEPHLALAREKAASEGLKNIEFVHIRSKVELDRLRGADVFYSHIVLQHNPPPLIAQIIDAAFPACGRRVCCVFFQVPTYGSGYAFHLDSYLGDLSDRGMETHAFPQKAVFDLAGSHGLTPLETGPDGSLGGFGSWISTCFLMKKAGRAADAQQGVRQRRRDA